MHHFTVYHLYSVAVAYGGASKMEQFKELRAGVEILVATPVSKLNSIRLTREKP
jgi:superfamily II DNA/RNA helicase